MKMNNGSILKRKMNIDEIKRILVFHGSGIGDVIATLPLISAIKRYFVNSEIYSVNDLIYADIGYKILEHVKGLKIVRYNSKEFLSLTKTILYLRKLKFDLIIDAYPGTKKTALFCYLVGGKIRAGFSDNPYHFLYDLKIPYEDKSKVELELEFLKKLGLNIKKQDYEIKLPFSVNEKSSKVQNILKKYRPPYICIYAGNEDLDKNGLALDRRAIQTNAWLNLINNIDQIKKSSFFLIGQDKPDSLIIKNSEVKVTNLVNKLDFYETITFLKKMDLFLTINGGPMWMSFSVKTPTIVLNKWSLKGWQPKGEKILVIDCNENTNKVESIDNVKILLNKLKVRLN